MKMPQWIASIKAIKVASNNNKLQSFKRKK
jgi:hypothetical protein